LSKILVKSAFYIFPPGTRGSVGEESKKSEERVLTRRGWSGNIIERPAEGTAKTAANPPGETAEGRAKVKAKSLKRRGKPPAQTPVKERMKDER